MVSKKVKIPVSLIDILVGETAIKNNKPIIKII